MTSKVYFEHPLNERSRTLLRLGHLFAQLDHHLPRDSVWDSRAAMTTLLDIAAVLSRGDIRSELIKELDRQAGTLSRITRSPHVDTARLNEVLVQLQRSTDALNTANGQLGSALRRNDFLKTIAQRSSIPGGNCDFDLPLYHYWLKRSHAEREADLRGWAGTLEAVHVAVELLLSLVRSSSHPVPEIARQGFFQRGLDTNAPVQLIRVAVSAEARLVAEISGGKHRFSIRFLEADDLERPMQTQEDVPFELTTCML